MAGPARTELLMRKGAQLAVLDSPAGPLAVVNTHLSANRDDDWSEGNRFTGVIRGELDDRYGHLFEGMQLERVRGTTVLAGKVRDQAQLYGFLERVEELGIELVSVQQTTDAT